MANRDCCSNDKQHTDQAYQLLRGDCLQMMKDMPDNSVDSIVTDPPYELGFMGKSWDSTGIANNVALWREAFRVLKPGGHVLAFSGSRTYHRMACAIEDAGFEMRDMIAWVYGSGFPKSMDVSKAIDKAAGAEREVVDQQYRAATGRNEGYGFGEAFDITAPATDAARLWEGWGTALKPAIEPIAVGRKPLIGTVAANVLAHGTGALNIDACRVPSTDSQLAEKYASAQNCGARENSVYGTDARDRSGSAPHDAGRWPANLIHDGSAEVVALFPDSNGSGGSVPNVKITGYGGGIGNGKSEYFGGERTKVSSGSGSASRFFAQFGFDDEDIEAASLFYCAKASRRDRNEGLDDPGAQFQHGTTLRDVENTATRGNFHPTVKPTDLCRYLLRLVTPPGGKSLDIFCGSGSFGKAAMLEGFSWIGIDLDSDENGEPLGYLDITRARVEHAYKSVHEKKKEPEPVEQSPQLLLFEGATE